jgi:hypothetical protein
MFGKGGGGGVVAPEPGPLGPAVDDLIKAALTHVLGAKDGGDNVALNIFFSYALLSLVCCLAIFATSKVKVVASLRCQICDWLLVTLGESGHPRLPPPRLNSR